jgi:hypothetical protein
LGVESLQIASNIHPSQTKILEGGTKDEILIFEAFFKGVSTRFGLRIVENSVVENPDFIFCSSFQNLRLGNIKFGFHLLFIRPKSSFGIVGSVLPTLKVLLRGNAF